MPIWNAKLTIKDLLSDYDVDIPSIGREINKRMTEEQDRLFEAIREGHRLHGEPPAFEERDENDYESVLDEFHSISIDSHATVAWLDDVLSALYDWGDYNRVWID